jgi:hypothetical protein
VVTESFWGQADAFGYSLSTGIDFFFRRGLALKYTFQYLSGTVEYLTSPQPRSGLSNALVLDARF